MGDQAKRRVARCAEALKEDAQEHRRNEIAPKPLKNNKAAKASVSRPKLFQGLRGLGRNRPFRSAKDCASFSAPNVAHGTPEQIARNPKSLIGQYLKPAPAAERGENAGKRGGVKRHSAWRTGHSGYITGHSQEV
jgi:hypothetical protein